MTLPIYEMKCFCCGKLIGEYLTDGNGLPNIWWFKCTECAKHENQTLDAN